MMTTIEKPGTILRVGPNGANEWFITLQNVVKTYVTPAGSFQALRGVDLRIREGEFMAVVGKSGSGKSTLLNMLTGIDRPTSGEVIAGGTAIHQLSEGEAARWRGRNVGIVFQFFQLLPTLTIVENIMLAMDFGKVFPVSERRSRALELLKRVGITEQAYKLPAMLSGGEQQRVAIARALANDVLEADEMWSFVQDRWNKRWLWTVLCRRTRQIVAFVLGDRSETICRKLWEQIPPAYKGCQSYSDFWEAYQLVFSAETHECVGKRSGQTNHMERWYCTLRQSCARFVRKTLSFSKSDTMHQIVTRLFIVRYDLSLVT